jgi:(E)-4-hydroxy-3-methylbut-2-enyl-diphosphate synthase
MVPLVAGVDPLPDERILIHPADLTDRLIQQMKEKTGQVVIAEADGDRGRDFFRNLFRRLEEQHCPVPVILKIKYPRMDPETLLIRASVDLGPLLVGGLGDGIWIEAPGQDPQFIRDLSFGILQGCRCRFTKTEFIACPSCGRTLFNIQETLRTIRERMGHLKNVKIAVMGCIVNGPGEMADADYGYVGSGPGKITLYKGKKVIKNNIDAGNALQELEKIIRDNGDWIDL